MEAGPLTLCQSEVAWSVRSKLPELHIFKGFSFENKPVHSQGLRRRRKFSKRKSLHVSATVESEDSRRIESAGTRIVTRFESKAQQLRRLLEGPSIIQGPCCYDGLSGRLVEMANFPVAVMSGFSVSATRLGLPDAGLLSYGEMVEQAGLIASAISIPLIADADTGYGNAVNVKRTVNGYRQAGVAALILEDQVWPKGCGHTKGRRVVTREEAVMRIRAAVDARDEGPGDILIVARSDARQAESLEEAIWRAQAYADAGADMVFVDALMSREDMKELCRAVPDVPKMANMLEGGKTPVLSPLELEELGFKLTVYPLSLLGVSIRAMQDALKALKTGRLPPSSTLPSFEEVKDVVGFPQYYAEEERYAASTISTSSPSESVSDSVLVKQETDLVDLPPPEVTKTTEKDDDTDGYAGDFECDDEQTPQVKAWAAASASAPGRVPGVSAFTADGSEVTDTKDSHQAKSAGPNQHGEVGSVKVQKEEKRKKPYTEVVQAVEIIEDERNGGNGGRTQRDSYRTAGTIGGMWSRVLRVKITDRMGSIKLDVRVPAGFLDGLASTVPAVAGLDLKSLLGGKIWETDTNESEALLDFITRDGSGDRVQIFLE